MLADDRRHECKRSSDWEKLAEFHGIVKTELEHINADMKNMREEIRDDIGKLFDKIDNIRLPKKRGTGKWEKLIYGAVATLIISVAAYVGTLIKG